MLSVVRVGTLCDISTVFRLKFIMSANTDLCQRFWRVAITQFERQLNQMRILTVSIFLQRLVTCVEFVNN